MNPFDFFEEIYCINLDERTDRWEKVQKEFEKAGILDRVKRFSAIKEKDGRVGVIKSNLEIIMIAKKKGLKNVLVFEDDAKFIVDNPQEVLQTSLDQIGNLKDKWYLFYLGANTHTKLIKYKPNLILLKNSFACHSICYNEKVYDMFIRKYKGLNYIRKQQDILDVYIAKDIQQRVICFMVNPMMCTQTNDFSNIEGHEVNYEFIEERFKKNIK